jgi:hypothetical protein
MFSAVSSRVCHLDHAALVAAALDRSRLDAEMGSMRARRRWRWRSTRVTKSDPVLAAE